MKRMIVTTEHNKWQLLRNKSSLLIATVYNVFGNVREKGECLMTLAIGQGRQVTYIVKNTVFAIAQT